MCEKCAEIELTIERFRSIKSAVSDQLTLERAQEVIADLEAQKATIHPQVVEKAAPGRYFFDIRDAGDLEIDYDGTVLRNIEAARAEATRALLDISRDSALAGQPMRPMAIEARDDHGPIFEVSVTVRLLERPKT